jgi:hypothetical protein
LWPPGCKPLNRDFRWTSVLAAELRQQSADVGMPVFCDIVFSRWGLDAKDLERLLLTVEVRSILSLENMDKARPGELFFFVGRAS